MTCVKTKILAFTFRSSLSFCSLLISKDRFGLKMETSSCIFNLIRLRYLLLNWLCLGEQVQHMVCASCDSFLELQFAESCNLVDVTVHSALRCRSCIL